MNLVALAADYGTTSTSDANWGVLIGLYLAFYLVGSIPLMLIFNKVGRSPWLGLVPILNWVILLNLVGRSGWWFILFLIPIVNIVIFIIVMNDLSKSFGHGTGFTLGLVLLTWVFMLFLGLDSASSYRGPAARGAVTA